ncbi:hypothetical protein KL86CLO1_11143 [uncultured Eubacteriales bacterium]|uniref:Uncharacterized protein n=1 Tax=uncultured Eubacteriales bacterium TaxID=172733 RepID=A0A212JI41_9FIRM|nr:hypothetical protein KL86CLO1_11143 [uncultured Eubacteriales bacterium]
MPEAQMNMLPDIFDNLLMSAQMEGLTVTEQIWSMCVAIAAGDCTLEDCLKQIGAGYKE